ncbi:MAG: tRNA 2-selenouridine(34) synthase MnmH [Chitinophagaceae bacterium]|nr:tRNA 2-selenouridine(34) synthase MnmH [Chitinophagaceae bacterium]
MAIEIIHIETFLELAKNHPVADVRSPSEYRHAHIPGAFSLPLFSDEERKEVGTLYKQISREVAIKKGLEFFGPKMIHIVEQAEEWMFKNSNDKARGDCTPSRHTLLLYCWRGGMRSAAIAWLLDLYGFKIYTLIGGYKSFRRYVLDIFKQSYRLNILGGFTGSGKTELLYALKQKGEFVIDLEKLASHKGSAFGNIGMPEQPTQEMFENLLAMELRSLYPQAETQKKPIWLEDESQRIGHVNIPNDFWNTMRNSPVFFLQIAFEERLKHICEEYGKLDKQRLADAIGRIREKLGGQNAQLAVELLQQGNIPECFRILLNYYDKYYLKGLHNRKQLDSLLHYVPCHSVSVENVEPLLQKANEKNAFMPA